MKIHTSTIPERAQRLLAKKPLIIDTETTGLKNPEIIQLSIVNVKGELRFNGKFRPLMTIEAGASRVHGHTAENLAGADEWKIHAEKINFILRGNPVTAYNLKFDDSAIWYTARLHQQKLDEFYLHECIMEMFAELYGDWNSYHKSYRWQKLSTAAKYFGIKNPAPHDAYGDALTALEVLKKIAEA